MADVISVSTVQDKKNSDITYVITRYDDHSATVKIYYKNQKLDSYKYVGNVNIPLCAL